MTPSLLQVGAQFAVFFAVITAAQKLEVVDEQLGVAYGDRLFVWHSEPYSWYDAKEICKQYGGSLAMLENREINSAVFRAFFMQDIAKEAAHRRHIRFSKSRTEPPKDHLMSGRYHHDEAWVDGLKAMHGPGTYHPAWYWVGQVPFGFKNFGAGYNNSDWNCLSVKPAVRDSIIFAERESYDLFWYGTDCETFLPFICQLTRRDGDQPAAIDELSLGSLKQGQPVGMATSTRPGKWLLGLVITLRSVFLP